MKRWGSKWMPLALKTGLCQSDRPGDSGSSDDANSAAGRYRRVTRRSCPRHHWPITRSWGVVRFPPRVRSRDVRGTRARRRCNRIPYALRLRWHGGRQRSITSPFQAASTRSGATRHTSTPMSSGSSRPQAAIRTPCSKAVTSPPESFQRCIWGCRMYEAYMMTALNLSDRWAKVR